MLTLLARWILNAAALLLVAYLYPGVSVESFFAAMGGGPEGFGGFAEAFGDIFSDIFGGGQGRGRSSVYRGADLRYNLEISLEQAARGTETKIRIPTMVGVDAPRAENSLPEGSAACAAGVSGGRAATAPTGRRIVKVHEGR